MTACSPPSGFEVLTTGHAPTEPGKSRPGSLDVTVDCTTHDDGGRMIARLSGVLCRPNVSDTRSLLLKCLAEQPNALFVDLTGLLVSEPLTLHVFTAAVRQAARWPGTPVLLCGPRPETARLLD